MNHYQVLFSGELANGAHEQTVQENVSRELGIDARKAAQLFSGRTVVIRSQLSQDDALMLQARLAGLGALCRIRDLTPKIEDKKLDYRIDRQDRAADHTLRDITAAHMECPRCSHMQLETSHCARCGIDIAAMIKAKHKEDLIIEKKIRELKLLQDKKNKRPGKRSPFGTRSSGHQARAENRPRQQEKKPGMIKSWFRKSS